MYGYTGVLPIVLFFTLKWFGSESANLLECWALYGYANIIWIPVALISWSGNNSEFQHRFKREQPDHGLTRSSPELCVCRSRICQLGILPAPKSLPHS
jgi:hypothetical protein